MEQSLFHSKTAVIVVDMLNDFVKGELSCEQSEAIVPPIRALLSDARREGVPIFYCNDHHIPDVDPELKLWGHHAIAGTEGAKIVFGITATRRLCDIKNIVIVVFSNRFTITAEFIGN